MTFSKIVQKVRKKVSKQSFPKDINYHLALSRTLSILLLSHVMSPKLFLFRCIDVNISKFPAICLKSPSIQRKLFGESLETFTNYSPFRKILSRASLSTANFIPPFLALRKCWHEIQTYKNRSFGRDAVLEELYC